MHKLLTLYREDFSNPLHPDLFNGILDGLGIDTHVKVRGQGWIDREIGEVTVTVTAVRIDSEFVPDTDGAMHHHFTGVRSRR